MRLSLLVTAVIGLALGYSMRPSVAGSITMWLSLTVPYVALAGLAVYLMYKEGTLADRLRLRGGDATIGILLAGVLLCGAWVVKTYMTPPASPQAAWLFHISLQLGNMQRSSFALATVFVLAVAEEVVWRGLVLDSLMETFGERRAWPAAAGLYGLAHVATLFTLAAPGAGPNPLLAVAALGCGLFWTFAASRLRRLPPVLISHVVFSYFAPVLLLPPF